jgi:putative tryptophan/tyrosine transport system substrate-binding protein
VDSQTAQSDKIALVLCSSLSLGGFVEQRGRQMRRRDLILGSIVSLINVPSIAQKAQKIRRIAIAHASTPITDLTIDGNNPLLRVFFEELLKLGYVEGQNIEIVRFSANGRTDHFREISAEIVQSGPELIVANVSQFVRTLKETTSTIPIVGITADPISYGLTSSLSRPDGNVTGVSVDAGLELWGKRLSILRELLPSASRVGFVTIRDSWEGPQGQHLSRAAQEIGITVLGPPLDDPVQPPEYRRVLNAMHLDKADAFIVGDASPNYTYRKDIVALANEYRMPGMYPFRDFIDEGGLIAYAVNIRDLWRRAADCVGELLRGAKVSDIPIYQASTFELIINSKAAQSIGLTIPSPLFLRADEVIE